jgi:hypothetical protein
MALPESDLERAVLSTSATTDRYAHLSSQENGELWKTNAVTTLHDIPKSPPRIESEQPSKERESGEPSQAQSLSHSDSDCESEKRRPSKRGMLFIKIY